MSGETDDYDEFGMLGDNAAEAGLTLRTLPPVTRASFTLAGGQVVSALAWGDAQPELVLLHGGAVPLLLVLGADSPFTGEQDVAEFRRRLPAARVEVVPGAGHAVQSDQPLALARLISDFVTVESDY